MKRKVNFQQDIIPQRNNIRFALFATEMQDNLNIITEFANTVSHVVKQFAELCREHAKRQQDGRTEFVDLQAELIRERKRRMELEDIIRQKVGGSPQNEQSISEIAGAPELRKRPKTAFTLFVADQRDKILRQHPSLNLNKIATLAAIKWKKLSRDQQQIYEKKLDEMNKLPIEEFQHSRSKPEGNIDANLVKKEFIYENEDAQREENNNYVNQAQGEQENKNNNQQIPQTQNYCTLQNGTIDSQPAEEVVPREKGVIQHMLDLFHTQNDQQRKQGQQQENQPIEPLQPLSLQPLQSNHIAADTDPSLQILESANQNNPIVIPPTIQQ